jgi:hypothetical protein
VVAVAVAAAAVAGIVTVAVVAAVAGNQRTICLLNAEMKAPQCASAAGSSILWGLVASSFDAQVSDTHGINLSLAGATHHNVWLLFDL